MAFPFLKNKKHNSPLKYKVLYFISSAYPILLIAVGQRLVEYLKVYTNYIQSVPLQYFDGCDSSSFYNRNSKDGSKLKLLIKRSMVKRLLLYLENSLDITSLGSNFIANEYPDTVRMLPS